MCQMLLRAGRVLPTSIELRLLEMQRKLSAIAEIPKILSSTLATVSQSFDSLEAEASYKRKCSYDEDALDYELLEQPESECDSELDESDDAVDDEEDDLVQVQDDDDAEDAVHKFKSESLKDATPESDYASEANYATNETSDEPDNGNDYEDDEVGDDEKAVFYLKLPAGADTDNTTRHTEIAARATAQLRADAVKNISSECDSSDLDEDEDEVAKDNNDSDFLSTTYTWNLRNVPKLRINDAEGVCNLTLLSPQLEQHNTIDDTSKVRAATPTPTPTPASMSTSTTSTEEAAHSQSQKLLFKLDNLERSWPWADREKIIYKQSTCHLVPRKPLGIVGQRIQLLAKQELQRKDKAQ